MPGITFPRAVEHVQDSLRDPLTPSFCVRYYLYFVYLIQFDHGVSKRRKRVPIASEKDSFFYSLSDITLSNLRATCPGLFQAFMIFIRTERSRDDMRALAQRMESCNCDRTDPVISEFHCWHWVDHAPLSCQYPTQRRDDMESLITAIGSLLSSPIEASVWAGHASRVLSSPESPSGWPFSLNDAFGPDPPKSATQLCRWLDEYPCFQLIHLLAYSFQDHAFESTLLRSATLPRTIVRLLNRGLAALPADFAARSVFDRFDDKLPLSLMAAFMSRTEGIEDGVSLAYFYDDQAEPLLDVLTRIGRVSEGLNDILLNMMLTGTGGAVHAKLVLPFDEARYHPHILVGSKQFKEKNISDACARPWQTTQNILYILTTKPMCANPTCGNEFDADTWQRCTACRRVLYCSAECQQADWGHATKPHKKICKTLKAVGDAVGFPAATTPAAPVISEDVFRNQCMKAGVSSNALELMLKRVLLDDRIMKILNAEPYSKRYERLT